MSSYTSKQFSTIELLDNGKLFDWMNLIGVFFGRSNFCGEFIFPNESEPSVFEGIHDLSSMIRKCDWRGRLVIAWSLDDDIVGSFELFRFDLPGKTKDLARMAQYQQNTISLSVAGAISRRCCSDDWMNCFQGSAELLEANYAVFHLSSGLERRMNLHMGIAAGLVDIFSLNYFGPRLVEMIGIETLMSAPVSKVSETRKGGVCVQTEESPCMQRIDRFAKATSKIRQHLGEEHFISNQDDAPEIQSGQISLFTFIIDVFRLKKDYERTDRLARTRPDFDWKGLFRSDEKV